MEENFEVYQLLKDRGVRVYGWGWPAVKAAADMMDAYPAAGYHFFVGRAVIQPL